MSHEPHASAALPTIAVMAGRPAMTAIVGSAAEAWGSCDMARP